MKERRRTRSCPRGLTRREFGLAGVAIAVAGCTPAPAPPPVDLAFYGDCRQYAKIHRKICNHIATRDPKATIVVGDLVNHPAIQGEWDEFHDITKVVRDRAPLLCAIGNHDVDPANAFLRELKLERNWYERVVGDFHFFVLDSNNCFRDKEQLDWFEKAAAKSTSKHRFVVFHHPPFHLDPRKMVEMPEVRANLHPLLAKMKVCAAF